MALTWPVEREGQPSTAALTEEPIRTIQYLLTHHGHTVAVDGIFGPKTTAAVKAFQKSRGLKADGIVGKNTWPKLIVTVKKGSKGEPVRAVQSQFQARNLSGDPSLGLQIDGIFGSKTDATVRGFQGAADLDVDGIVGPNTWNALINGTLAG